MVDRYTKVVLTVIAAALVWLCLWGSGIPRGTAAHAYDPEVKDVNIVAIGHLPVTPPEKEARWSRHGLPVQEVSAPGAHLHAVRTEEHAASRAEICRANFKIVNTAIQAYFAQNKQWPARTTDMLPPGDRQATTPAGLKSGQLTELPICPFERLKQPRPYNLDAVYEDPTDLTSPIVGKEVDWRNHWRSGTWVSPSTEHLP